MAQVDACPPAPAATQGLPLTPRQAQAELDALSKPVSAIPTNARIRVSSFVGALEDVPVRLLVNGVPVTVERSVVDEAIELRATKPFPAGAKVLIEVDGIRSGTYEVGRRADGA